MFVWGIDIFLQFLSNSYKIIAKGILKTNSSKSPWSNSLCEIHNQSLKKDMKSNYETLLSWVVCAKNTSLSNINGFSPQ